MKFELRQMTFKAEVRAEGDGEKIISGIIPYNTKSLDMGFIEVIKPGAFTKSLKEGDIRALWNHDTNYILGRSSNGSLSLADSEEGLRFEIKVPEGRQYALDAFDVIKTGDADGVSFGFRTIKDAWTDEKDKPLTRDLLEAELREISVGVTFPAYPDSKAQTRAFEEAVGFDLSRLAALMVRSKNGYFDATGEEKTFLETSAEYIRSIIGGETPPSEPVTSHSEESEPGKTTLRRLSLDLLEKSFN